MLMPLKKVPGTLQLAFGSVWLCRLHIENYNVWSYISELTPKYKVQILADLIPPLAPRQHIN